MAGKVRKINMSNLFDELYRIILIDDAKQKCVAVKQLSNHFKSGRFSINNTDPAKQIVRPGLPPQLELVAPRKLKRRGIQSQTGRNILMHSIAHIEFNAINLALDAAYRFREQPIDYYSDWISIADDEARHFSLISDYLNQNDCDYGDYPAHNGLWEMAVKTEGDVVARMALVPRVLEARGLDVTPAIIKRLQNINDQAAVNILNVIYQDEISHVETGSHWFFHHCELRKLEPKATFLKMVKTHLHGELRGPFNISARLAAGFDETELTDLSMLYGPVK